MKKKQQRQETPEKKIEKIKRGNYKNRNERCFRGKHSATPSGHK